MNNILEWFESLKSIISEEPVLSTGGLFAFIYLAITTKGMHWAYALRLIGVVSINKRPPSSDDVFPNLRG